MRTRQPSHRVGMAWKADWHGALLARALSSTQAEVIATDRQSKLVESLRDDVTLAVRLDSSDEEALKAQGVHEVDVAIVGIGDDFESSALTVATLKSLGVRRIIARAENEMQAQILSRVGADEVASPEAESALRWAHRLSLPNLKRFIELGPEHSIVYRTAPRAFHHKTLRELDLRNRCGVNLIAIERRPTAQVDATAQPVSSSTDGGAAESNANRRQAHEGQPTTVPEATDDPIVAVPGATTVILPNDILVLVGSNDDLSALPKS